MGVVAVVFGLLIIGGLLLHRWGQRRAAEVNAPGEQRDLRDLADPSRWPAPPPEDGNGATASDTEDGEA